jgi:hypothetical protein
MGITGIGTTSVRKFYTPHGTTIFGGSWGFRYWFGVLNWFSLGVKIRQLFEKIFGWMDFTCFSISFYSP